MVKPTPHPIEGTWLPFKAELSGEIAPELALSKISLTLQTGAYSVEFGGEPTDSGTYELGFHTEIHTLTLVSLKGTNKGRTIPSIFQLVGDRLRVCYGLDGETPKTFAAPAGSKLYLVSYRRKN